MPSDNPNATATATQQRRPPRTLPHQLLSTADILHQASGPAVAATNAESIPCPRCDSKNTKFCYYNNYNLSQPRHFCKSCRRYWTHGGTLRNIPVGGGTRKSSASISTTSSSSSNKRPRCFPTKVSPCSSSSALSCHDGVGATEPQTVGSAGVKGASASSLGLGFSSLLSVPGSNTFLALGGHGLGYVPALDGIGFGLGRGVWSFPDKGFVEGADYGCFQGPIVGPTGLDAWHIGGSTARDGEGGGGGGLIDGETFAGPELAISMPGQGLK